MLTAARTAATDTTPTLTTMLKHPERTLLLPERSCPSPNYTRKRHG